MRWDVDRKSVPSYSKRSSGKLKPLRWKGSLSLTTATCWPQKYSRWSLTTNSCRWSWLAFVMCKLQTHNYELSRFWCRCVQTDKAENIESRLITMKSCQTVLEGTPILCCKRSDKATSAMPLLFSLASICNIRLFHFDLAQTQGSLPFLSHRLLLTWSQSRQ